MSWQNIFVERLRWFDTAKGKNGSRAMGTKEMAADEIHASHGFAVSG